MCFHKYLSHQYLPSLFDDTVILHTFGPELAGVNGCQWGSSTGTFFNKPMVIWEDGTSNKATGHSCKCPLPCMQKYNHFFPLSAECLKIITANMVNVHRHSVKQCSGGHETEEQLKVKRATTAWVTFLMDRVYRQNSQQWKNGQINNWINKLQCNVSSRNFTQAAILFHEGL